MKCVAGINLNDSSSVACSAMGGSGKQLAYQCAADVGFVAPDVSNYAYRGSDGYQTGDTYCLGKWESPNGLDKKMNCFAAVNLNDYSAMGCNVIDRSKRPAYQCTRPAWSPNISMYNYKGNNGSVSGDTYCGGNWESSNGANKNMKCTAGINLDDYSTVNCNIAAGYGIYGYQYV